MLISRHKGDMIVYIGTGLKRVIAYVLFWGGSY
jgi:hypothetical protein